MSVAFVESQASTAPRDPVEGRRIRIRGTVQGVGFRPWVYRTARRVGVAGRVQNDSAGVTIEAFADPRTLARFVDELATGAPPASSIADVVVSTIPPEDAHDFRIVESDVSDERRVSIPPDLATCDECAAEIVDPVNRRYRYAFTNCTNCGPRFTIAVDVPYDRATTTMAPFVMCPNCGREYADPADRRFHAQPNACPTCGPQLTFSAQDGSPIDVEDPISAAADALRAGLIVAVKGLGGFHLACDATSREAVRRLRERKHRDEKPLAVMVADIDAADAVAIVDGYARQLLRSIERPIVLLPARADTPLAPNVAPRNRQIGVFLPYSPLHHLLLAETGRPLVMTSGNLSDEPIAFTNDDAVKRLGPIADFLLLHDRDIQTRTDDSVVSIVAGHSVVLRRSRGFVPRSVRLRSAFARPVLACGALLKNTFCLGAGEAAWLGPHIGDLENVETYDSYTDTIDRLERFLRIAPEVIAHDLHPDYLSTAYALARPEAIKIAVQHHHAHVVSAMADRGIDGPAIGIAYDGTGFGTDGTMWGGEVLVADAASFERVGTFRPIPLIGGDRAIHEPWRIALALVVDAFDGALPPTARRLLAAVAPADLAVARELLEARLNTPLARGVGRYFDGFGALVLGRQRARFEGQIALEWNQAADPEVSRRYAFAVDEDAPVPEIDLRPAVRAAIADMERGESIGAIAAAFHETLADATAALVRRAATRYGRLPVVASGGCFQNARLAESVCAALQPEHEVVLHANVPPGDVGIALGQAVIADAKARSV